MRPSSKKPLVSLACAVTAFAFLFAGASESSARRHPAANGAGGKRLTAEQIMTRVAQQTAFGFETGDAKLQMIQVDRDGEKRLRGLSAKAMRPGDDGDRRILLRFNSPASERGTAMLLLEHADVETDMYLYLPAAKRTRRIVGGDKRDSFVGTDFSFGDMERTYMRNAEYDQKEDTKMDGHACYHIIAYPEDKKAYKKMEIFVRKKDFQTQQIRYYDRRGKFLKVYKIHETREDPDAGTIVTKAQMYTKKAGTSTFLIVKKYDTGARLKQVDFTVESLPR